MKGDFTRNTFDPRKHFARVLMQQGRVQLDADWNEQVAIFWHYLRTLVTDLVGPHWGPADGDFKIVANGDSFTIGSGHYYVNGILCENYWRDKEGNRAPRPYDAQPGFPFAGAVETFQDNQTYLVYLDVWERHITCIQDDTIREVALGGPDTATRAQVVWQVKAVASAASDCPIAWQAWLSKQRTTNRGWLKARSSISEDIDMTDPCITAPESRYRGAENQLYRVEIHRSSDEGDPTFKWSRDNGSVVFPLQKPARFSAGPVEVDASLVQDTATVTLEHLGRDSRFSLAVGDWVELVDDDYVLQGIAQPLWQVEQIDRVTMEVILTRKRSASLTPYHAGENMWKNPLLRRWDHKEGDPTEGGLELHEGAALIREGKDDTYWLKLEDGIQIQFQQLDPGATYRTGDYWLIPARTATGDVEWPGPPDEPEALPPHGVDHHYAPLAIISSNNNQIDVLDDCRCSLDPLCLEYRYAFGRMGVGAGLL